MRYEKIQNLIGKVVDIVKKLLQTHIISGILRHFYAR